MFIAKTLDLLNSDLEKIQLAFTRVPDQALWQKTREGINSIGNLCLHLAGNEYHNIASSIGGRPFERKRSAEFLTEGGFTRAELSDRLVRVREESHKVLEALAPDDLQRKVMIYYPSETGLASSSRTIMDLLYHVTAHYAYHTGQIVYIARLLQDQDEHLLKWRH